MFSTIRGNHFLVELYNCDYETLNNKELLVDTLISSAIKGKAGVLGQVSHKFFPFGVTVLVLLSESHLSLHSWPEDGYAMLDVATCGTTVNSNIIFEEIHKVLGGEALQIRTNRGIPKNNLTKKEIQSYILSSVEIKFLNKRVE